MTGNGAVMNYKSPRRAQTQQVIACCSCLAHTKHELSFTYISRFHEEENIRGAWSKTNLHPWAGLNQWSLYKHKDNDSFMNRF